MSVKVFWAPSILLFWSYESGWSDRDVWPVYGLDGLLTPSTLSLNELSILVLLWMIGIVTFGSIIYYADNNEEVSEEDGQQVVSTEYKYTA